MNSGLPINNGNKQILQRQQSVEGTPSPQMSSSPQNLPPIMRYRESQKEFWAWHIMF